MRLDFGSTGLLSAAALFGGSAAYSLNYETTDIELYARAAPDAPNAYTPSSVTCPSTRPSIRNGSSLSNDEVSWLPVRRNATIQPMRDLLSRIAIPGFDSNAYIDKVRNNATALPNIGIAISGGGYRAMLNGAGALAGWDNRTVNSTGAGHLGGLLQSATYLSALSGGGWLVGSIYLNNFTYVQQLQNSSIWQFGDSILEGPPNSNFLGYWRDVLNAVNGKRDAGYNASITDYWGRTLSYQLINAPDGGPSYTFSSIQDFDGFKSGNTPLPLLVADGRAPGEKLIALNTTIFEFNPWEMGSFDDTLSGFAPMRYVGSNFSAGQLPSNESCVRGFDNAGFVMGTSSSLFNQFVLQLQSANGTVPDFILSAAASLLNGLGNDNNDIADWTPNPFYGWNNVSNAGATSKRLTLVDGGEDLQNIPYHPLIQRDRNVDVIFSVDSSCDTVSCWPNGASIVATYQRQTNSTIANGTSFPAVPDNNTFVNLGLGDKPTFFGCNSSNTSTPAPLVVYIPYHPYEYLSNISTFTLNVSNPMRNAMITNGYDVVTMGNGTRDSQWPVCVGCAILKKSWEKTGTSFPDACNQCFDRYCWNGTVNATKPNAFYPPYANPNSVIKVTSGSGVERIVPMTLGMMIAVGWAVALLLI